MKSLVFLAAAMTGTLALRETVQQAALHARSLLHKESILTLSSVFSDEVNPALAGQPFAYLPPNAHPRSSPYIAAFSWFTFWVLRAFAEVRLTEYYCDCSTDGTPSLLLMDLEITTRNMGHGSPLSVSIDTTPPKGIYSIASLPRMNLNGRMELVQGKKEEEDALECYLSCHPDAHEWTPDNPDAPHRAKWYQFHVDSVYYFGGFGNVSYIGFLPIDMYRGIKLDDIKQHKGFFVEQTAQ